VVYAPYEGLKIGDYGGTWFTYTLRGFLNTIESAEVGVI